MKDRSVKMYLTTVCLLMTALSVTPALADWSINRHEYHNGKYGNFVPADINKKLFGHLNSEAKQEVKISPDSPSSNHQAASPGDPQTTTAPVANYSQQQGWRPAYNRYNQGQYFTPPGNQRYNRNTSFNGPWNNRSGFNGPWNNRGSNFSGPWNNNGSSFSMPWRNNNGSNFSPWGNGGNWGW